MSFGLLGLVAGSGPIVGCCVFSQPTSPPTRPACHSRTPDPTRLPLPTPCTHIHTRHSCTHTPTLTPTHPTHPHTPHTHHTHTPHTYQPKLQQPPHSLPPPDLPATACYYLLLPATACHCLPLPATARHCLLLPCHCLPLPATACHCPATACYCPPSPTWSTSFSWSPASAVPPPPPPSESIS